jgi:hypothetical protein
MTLTPAMRSDFWRAKQAGYDWLVFQGYCEAKRFRPATKTVSYYLAPESVELIKNKYEKAQSK